MLEILKKKRKLNKNGRIFEKKPFQNKTQM